MNAPEFLPPFTAGGKIMLVGLGPGSHDHLTARARAAIAEADTVIGYVTYIRLVAELLEGKEVIRKSMTEELDRAIEALERARLGRKVALVSSGDAGVYGMAGPTFEVLFQAGWTPDCGVEVEIVPGASALNTCAALVGAPLTHDFCAISLSDLLTPWPTIARRLDAVAYADFVVALYNPKSGRRTRQIVEAQRLFLRHRRPDTPVAIVKSAYRPKQRIEFTTLDRMAEADIGMLSTVLIGNSNTFVREGLMVTPRGYANKYEVAEGERATRDGEQAGRSLSTGLDGWLQRIRASGLGAAQLAADHRLPEDYIAALLAEEDAVAARL
ncbi:MAG: precorrin-3B C(17)-methyltransferase [Gammaproteobacteria bacterium]